MFPLDKEKAQREIVQMAEDLVYVTAPAKDQSLFLYKKWIYSHIF